MKVTVKELLTNSTHPLKSITLEDFEELCYEFNINFYSYNWNHHSIKNSNIKIKELKSWFDVDTMVGVFAFYVKDMPTCIRYQEKRKVQPEFKFFDYDLGNKLYNEIVNLMPKKSISMRVDVIGLNDRIKIK
jgi:hypothetical protein